MTPPPHPPPPPPGGKIKKTKKKKNQKTPKKKKKKKNRTQPGVQRAPTVNRSTFVNKKSREQFQLSSFKRLIDIYNSTAKTVDALMKLELPSGVEVEIKV